MKGKNNQQGFVSLFTVVFFMLLVSIVTVGFIRIMSIEQRQALDNDLTASALSAAESGVEDAKRAILRYYQEPDGALKTALHSALTSNSCNALFTTPAIANALNLSTDGSITGQSNLKLFYTCLNVNLNSPDYISKSSAGESEFIPLRVASPSDHFDRIRISWHLASNVAGTEGDGMPDNYPTDTLFPQVAGSNPARSWSNQGYPAYMRVQYYGYPDGNFTRNNVNDRTRTVMLVPSSAGGGIPISTSTADPSHTFYEQKQGVRTARCEGAGSPPAVPVGTYACSSTILLPDDPTLRGNNNNYFLRVTPIYGATHYKVEMMDGANVVEFSEVQPVIDSTGRANDVFRRVQARVKLTSVGDLPEYAAESVDDICKNMEVSDGSYYRPNNCP